jgi:hypothetical protein
MDKKVNDRAVELVTSLLGDNYDIPYSVKASDQTFSGKVTLNQIHYLDWNPVIHVYDGSELRVFSALDVFRRGHVQHGPNRMNMSVTLADVTPVAHCDLDAALFVAYAEAKGYDYLRTRLSKETEIIEAARNRIEALQEFV